MSSEDKTAVIEECQHLNIIPKKTKNCFAGRKTSAVKQSNKSVAKLTKQISALKARVVTFEKRKSDKVDDNAPEDNAGDQFGGRNSKKSRG